MSKIWFFVEGFSEENFVINLLRKYYYSKFKLEKDLSDFVFNQSSDRNICYCHNSQNVEKIPYDINEKYFQIEKSNAEHIFIICDVEELGCYTARKQRIESKLKNNVDKTKIKYIFSNPDIEIHYWECLNQIKRIIKKRLSIEKPNQRFMIEIPKSLPRTQEGLRRAFKKNGVPFRKKYISENFFSAIDYNSCKNLVLKRIIEFLDYI